MFLLSSTASRNASEGQKKNCANSAEDCRVKFGEPPINLLSKLSYPTSYEATEIYSWHSFIQAEVQMLLV